MTRYALDGSVFTIDDARAWLAHHGLVLAHVDESPGRAVFVARLSWWRHALAALGFGRSVVGLTLDLQDDLEPRVPAGYRFVVQIARWHPWR